MARLPCTFPGARPAVGPRWLPARIVRRAARPLPSSAFCSFRIGLTAIAAVQCGLVAAFERTCPIHERVIRPCEMVFINTEIAVETLSGIAFANDNEEPAKGRQGRDH